MSDMTETSRVGVTGTLRSNGTTEASHAGVTGVLRSNDATEASRGSMIGTPMNNNQHHLTQVSSYSSNLFAILNGSNETESFVEL